MTRQDKRKGESIDSLLRKFKRKIKNEGTLKSYVIANFLKNRPNKKETIKSSCKTHSY